MARNIKRTFGKNILIYGYVLKSFREKAKGTLLKRRTFATIAHLTKSTKVFAEERALYTRVELIKRYCFSTKFSKGCFF